MNLNILKMAIVELEYTYNIAYTLILTTFKTSQKIFWNNNKITLLQ